MSVKFVFLTQKFYDEYSECSEIEQKPNRPYVCVVTKISGVDFAVPLRSNIHHPHALITDTNTNAGLDFSKAIVISDKEQQIDSKNLPHIRQHEFDFLRGKEKIIQDRMQRYLHAYQKAKREPDIPRNQNLLSYSTLKYFEPLLNKIEESSEGG